MASPQFIHLLGQLHQMSELRQLHWQPVRKSRYTSRCDFSIALGNGVVRLESNDDDEQTLNASYKAYLITRDGLIVDELIARQYESDHYPALREIYRQARIAAFNLTTLVDEMQADLESGVVRDLPDYKFDPDDIPD
jgi:hypothetical protein